MPRQTATVAATATKRGTVIGVPVSSTRSKSANTKGVKRAQGTHDQWPARQFSPAGQTPSSEPSAADRLSVLPNLRDALRLYVLVLLATTVLVLSLLYNIDIVFLRLSAALFVFCGFTTVGLLIRRIPIGAVFGRLPNLPVLILGFFSGAAVWTPATWSLLVITQFLGVGYGNLPPRPITTASPTTVALLFVGIVPFSEGFLFFCYLLSAARGLGTWRGIWLTAFLFGLFGMFADQYGLSAIPAYFLLGAIGSALTIWSGSAWMGIIVLSGFSVGQQLIGATILATFLKDQYTDVLSFNWIAAALLFAFATFALTQVARAFRSRQPLLTPAKPGRTWWFPLLLVVVLGLIVANNEIQTRRRNPPQLSPIFVPAQSGSIAPPVAIPNPTLSTTP